MADPIGIWVAAQHHKAFLNGGWAYVRVGAEVTGWAGGDRRTTRTRMALSGLAAALADLPKGAALRVETAAEDAKLLDGVFVEPADPPTDDLDLRAAIAGLLKGHEARLAVMSVQPRTPLAFAIAWADQAADKAKMTGAFRVAIPRPNLAKSGAAAS